MARNELKLDAETTKAMEVMRNEAPEPVEEIKSPEPEVVAPEPVKVDEPKSEPAEKDPSPVEKTVPLAALQETREALKEEKRRNEEIQRRTDERLRLLTEAMTKAPESSRPAAVIPDPEKDALGALKANQQQLRELMDYKQRTEAQQAEGLQRQNLINRAQQLEAQFVQETPDYGSASQFLIKSRQDELLATGMYTPQQVHQTIQGETMALAQQAINNGTNPAQIIYNIAKARGYTKSELAKLDASVETDAQKFDRVAAGQAASKSVGQALGAQVSSGKAMDSKTLANMSDDDFANLYSKLSRGERAALMGN